MVAEPLGGTKAGTLPDGWRMVTFGEMAQSVNDRVDNPAEAGVERYVGLEHLDPDTLHLHRWGLPTDVEATKLRFKPGDVIFGRRRAYQRKLAVADFEGICSAHALVLRARTGTVEPRYLPVFMQSELFFKRALEISVGSLSPTINWKTLAVQPFPLPPKEEQRHIADILWAADDAVERWREAADGIANTFESVRRRWFEDDEATPIQLVDLCETQGIRIGPFGSQLHVSDYQPEGIPVVMPTNMVDGRISTSNIARVSEQMVHSLERHRLKAGDILLPRRGEMDRRALVTEQEEGWLCGTGSVRLRPRQDLPSVVLFQALTTEATVRWLNENAVGTTMPNLNVQIVSRLPLRLPEPSNWKRAADIICFLEQSVATVGRHINGTKSVTNQLHENLIVDAVEQHV